MKRWSDTRVICLNKQGRQNETPRGETYLWHLHPNCTQMWDVNFFFAWILCYLWYIVGIRIIMLPVVSWFGRPQVKMEHVEANYWIKQGVYCTYVMFDKSRMLFISVRDWWHDCERKYQSYTFTLDKWLKMSIITYVASSQRSRTSLFCYVKCHIRFWPSWT